MPNLEDKICQNCKQNFTIEPEDFDFYKKIDVPPPTWCPECRLIRKLAWRNDRTLYKRKCDLCNKNIISIYPDSSSLKVFCQDCWWSDKWDPLVYGIKYNFNKPLFNQLNELSNQIPVMNLFNTNAINSDYCNYAGNSKDCYLFVGGRESESVLYGNRVFSSRNSLELYDVNKVEQCYECVQSKNCYRLYFSQYCSDCNDSWFLYDCRNCHDCFGCTNLRGQQYYIFNKPYTKEEYIKRIIDFDVGSFINIVKIRAEVENQRKSHIRRFAHVVNSPSSTGDNLYNARNCKQCFDVTGTDSEDSKYDYFVGVGIKDSYDNYGVSRLEESCETLATGFESVENSRYFFSYFIKGSHDINYSYNCQASSDLFACIGLRNKSYCILNKQYTKEEYEELVPKIIQHMNDMPYVDSQGRVYRYGEFFPPELSPFAYNETIAQEYFPLTKEEAISQGYRWKDPEERNYTIDIKNQDLPDHIKDVSDDILGKVIECAHSLGSPSTSSGQTAKTVCNEQCTEAFKIIPQELQFYRQMNLPLPRLCPNCRHYQRLKQRNPLKLWHRHCQCKGKTSENGVYTNAIQHQHGDSSCPNEFQTSYAPERPEIVYCEQCYNSEVV